MQRVKGIVMLAFKKKNQKIIISSFKIIRRKFKLTRDGLNVGGTWVAGQSSSSLLSLSPQSYSPSQTQVLNIHFLECLH